MELSSQGEILLVSSSEKGGIAELLQDAAPHLRVRCVRRLNGRFKTSSVSLVVVHETAASAARTPPSAVDGVPTMIITERPSATAALAAIEHGVDGYLAADISADALRAAVTAVLRGELAYSRQTLGAWLQALRTQPRVRDRVDLTPRQSQIVELIATGATDKEIAATIGVATATAQKHVARLLRRLGVRNRAAAVAAQRPHASRLHARLTG
jgi:DNA-binding NarL/FixJ family response regulator